MNEPSFRDNSNRKKRFAKLNQYMKLVVFFIFKFSFNSITM